MFLVFLVYALFASVFTLQKQALDYSTPLFLVASRMMVAGLILIGATFIRNPHKLRPFYQKELRKEVWIPILLLAFFNIYFTNILELWGLKYLSSFKTCFLYSLSPFISALVSYLLLKEEMTFGRWVGLFIGFSGFLPILLTDTSIETAVGEIWFFSWPELAVIGAVFASVLGWVLLKQLVQHQKLSTKLVNGASMFIGGAMALIHSCFVDPWHGAPPVTEWRPFVELTVALLIISNLIAYNLYGHLLKRFSQTFMSFAGLSTPLFTALFGWIFLGEQVTFSFFISLFIVFIGLYVFYKEELVL